MRPPGAPREIYWIVPHYDGPIGWRPGGGKFTSLDHARKRVKYIEAHGGSAEVYVGRVSAWEKI